MENPEIIVTHEEDGVQVKVNAHSRIHALWMLLQAQSRLIEDMVEGEEDEVQELSTSNGESKTHVSEL